MLLNGFGKPFEKHLKALNAFKWSAKIGPQLSDHLKAFLDMVHGETPILADHSKAFECF